MCREGVLEVRRTSNFMTTKLDSVYHAFQSKRLSTSDEWRAFVRAAADGHSSNCMGWGVS